MASHSDGVVYLVGAGPGHPDSISLRARELLASADEVLYDYLVNTEILAHAPVEAECICLGRHGRSSLWKPEEIHARMVDSARRGRRVVRLKSGDPLVFGRAAGELAALVAAQVRFEIVPGITAAMAAPSFAGIPITDRDRASAVAFVTGQEDPSKPDSKLDFDALARFPGTLVFYMGVTTAAEWTRQLLHHGASPDLPVALVRRCGWPNQQILRCRLDEVVDRVTPYSKFPPPVLAIVGRAADAHVEQYDWFSTRPLFGQSVLVTRPAHQASSLAKPLSELGAEVLLQPVVELCPEPFDCTHWAERLMRCELDTLVFTSSNGVEHFVGRLWNQGFDLRLFAGLQLVTVGPATDQSLEKYHLRGDGMPSDQRFNSESLIELFATQDAKMKQATTPEASSEKRVLIVRGETSRNVLAPGLRDQGHHVEELVVYRTDPVTTLDAAISERLEDQTVDWGLATSAALAKQATDLFGAAAKNIRWVAISDRTADALREEGCDVRAVAEQPTMKKLVDALVGAVDSDRPT